MKNRAFLTKLEKQFDVSIFNFQYFSGDSYKAGFSMIYNDSKSNNDYTANIVIKADETYAEGIERYFDTNKKIISTVSDYLSL